MPAPPAARLSAWPALAAQAADQREQAAERDQRAAEPDQGDERLPPQAQLPAALLVLHRRSRRRAGRPSRVWIAASLVGGRRRAEQPRLRAAARSGAPSPRRDASSRASIAVQFGPATGATPSKRTAEGADPHRLARAGGDQGLLGEGAFRRHAGERDGDAEMGDHHAPGEERRAPQIAAPQAARGWPRRRRARGRGRATAARRMPGASSDQREQQRRRRAAPGSAIAAGRASRDRRGASAAAAPLAMIATSTSATGPGDAVEIRRPDRDLRAERLGDQRIDACR